MFLQIVKFVFLIPLDLAGQFVDYVGFDGRDVAVVHRWHRELGTTYKSQNQDKLNPGRCCQLSMRSSYSWHFRANILGQIPLLLAPKTTMKPL